MAYTSLVISGGGVRGIAALGALHYFDSDNKLKDINTYVGTSIGSVICLLLACGYTPMEILENFIKIDVARDIRADVWSVMKTYGFVDIDRLVERISSLIKKKLDIVPTFSKLLEITGKKFVAVSANVTRRRPEYFSPETTPHLSCLDAVKMSCNIPLFFQKIMYNNNIYVDGGLVDNFPILYVDDGKHDVLGINMISDEKDVSDDGLLEYIYKIIMMPSQEINKIKIERVSPRATIINLVVNAIPIDMTMDRESKMDMFVEGFNSAKLDMEIREWKWDD